MSIADAVIEWPIQRGGQGERKYAILEFWPLRALILVARFACNVF